MSLAIQRASGASYSVLGTIGGVIGAIGGFVTGGPGGAVAGATAGQAIGNAIGGSGQTPPAGAMPGTGFGGFNFGPSSGTPTATPGTAVATCGCKSSCKGDMCSATYGCGSHLNRHWLAPTKGTPTRPAHGWQAPGTWCVRRRKMNPLNIRALRRADRRAHAFLRITRKVVKHYVAKQPKGRSYIHARRGRK